MAFSFLTGVFNERLDVLGAPDGRARTKLQWFWIAAGCTAFPPCALADGEQFQNLGKTKKTSGRNISRQSDNSVCNW